jgi:hypothetical protein
VVANIQPIPFKVIPPVLLTVHNGRESILVNGWETLQTPAASYSNSLELGSKHFGLADMSQAREMMEVQVLEPWEFQHAISMLSSYFI